MTPDHYKTLMMIGVLLFVVGGMGYLNPGWLSWMGRLPGDIRVERENFRLYLPLATMILLSIFLSVLLRWWRG